ncbi:MAG TPA: hypothetical protein VFW87_19135 [Pirellulales bacterium]|nr:hypothetical protein [Pirellulales bacterium]
MQVECGHCKKRYSIADENAGKQFLCRACGKKSLVAPVAASAPAAAASKTAAPKTAQATTGQATLSVTCPKCGKQYQNVPATAVGKQFKCKICQEVSPIRAAPAPAAKQARPAGASPAAVRKDIAVAGKPAPRPAAKPAAAKTAAMASAGATAKPAGPLASDPLTADPLGQDLFGGSANLLDLMGDAPLPGGSAGPLTSPLPASPLLAKPPAAAPAKKPKAKKKKKKGDSTAGDNATVILRMMGGGFIGLCGLGLIVWGIVLIANPDDSGLHVMRAIRRFIGGASLIGAACKTIVG